jgi:lipoyl(octanoyl) transferase
MLFERLLVHDDGARAGAALNMAIDEALLEHAIVPILRFYGWRRPALSFGYFGKFADVAMEMERRDVVRRWTGGGIVPHGEDLTYSLVTPAVDPASSHGPTAIYAALHGAIRDALRKEGNKAELAARASPKISEACFANPVRDDVMLSGRKIAGAAQRRTRAGFLHQGSIQIPDLPVSFRARFASRLAEQIEWVEIPPPINERAAQLVTEKYGTAEWLRRW